MRKSLGVRLKKGKEAIFHNRHLWIFSGAIESFPDRFENGSIYPVYDFAGTLLGHAYFNQKMSLSGRIVSRGNEDPMDAIYRHLERAIQFRKALFDPKETSGFRLVGGEGDFLPGLIIDQYDKSLVLQSNTLGIDRLKNAIIDFLLSKKEYEAIHEKSATSSRKEEGLEEVVTTLFGEAREELTMQENGLTFHLNWKRGQKTGFFLDQREMRKKIGDLSQGKRVLNCFSYTGGFSVYSLQGGAVAVDSLDCSSQAIAMAKRNVEANGLSLEKSGFIEEDAFLFLEKSSLDYDIVILDPPAFAKKKGDIKRASDGYRQINIEAMSKMPQNSLLLTCSCSYYIDEELFQTILFQAAKKANREIQIVSKHILAMDHPISIFHKESSYLKSFLLRLL